MRVGASILLKDGYCYQSYGWNKLRPLGGLQNAISSLEEYQSDEISIIRPARENNCLSSLKEDLAIMQKINCMTPISFGGGLRNVEAIDLLHGLPIERLIFSSIFFQKKYSLVEYAINLYGHQAIQCSMPFRIENGKLYIFHPYAGSYLQSNQVDFSVINRLSNEIILLDTGNEGSSDKFDMRVLDFIDMDPEKIVISGGIGMSTIKTAKEKGVASVLIDNKSLHIEYSIKGYKGHGRVR